MKARLFRLAVLLFAATASAVAAQQPADSLALVGAPWKTVRQQDGLVAKRASLRVFGTDQQISCIEIDPGLYRLALAQDSLRTQVSRLGRENGAAAAINGGFFRTRTDLAIAGELIKISGGYPPADVGSHSAVLGIDSSGRPHFTVSRQTKDSLWQARFPDVLIAGPMLLLAGKSLHRFDPDEMRHPRSCIGVKADGTIVLIVVDGRQKKADGMGIGELAYTLRILGLTDAMNLDGGGSSTLWIEGGKWLNSPSDRILFFPSERKVANAVLVKKR